MVMKSTYHSQNYMNFCELCVYIYTHNIYMYFSSLFFNIKVQNVSGIKNQKTQFSRACMSTLSCNYSYSDISARIHAFLSGFCLFLSSSVV